jgi:hypothetical protein
MNLSKVPKKISLTNPFLKALPKAPEGDRYQVMDTQEPGFGLRVNADGVITFILQARYPGSANPTRRELGKYPALTLEKGREKARDWKTLIKAGTDPALVEERARLERQRHQANNFGMVAEAWFAAVLRKQRAAKNVEREFRQYFVAAWEKRPITEIEDLDVLAVINMKLQEGDGKPGMARQLFNHAKRFFNWALHQRVYGLKFSPMNTLSARHLFGKRIDRDRVLEDDELIALWRATFRVPYPIGPLYRALLLSPRRVEEFSRAVKKEVNRRTGVWTIPAERMKGRDGEAKPHEIPLTDDLLAILDALPENPSGPFLFSTTGGEKVLWMSGKVKDTIDEAMLIELKALAVERGDDPSEVELEPWVTHDIRRTIRTRLSRLRIDHDTKEALLAHVKPGIVGVYDKHEYFDEKRETMDKWAACLKSIVDPSPDNVVPLRKAS